jgi:SET and MYND domain-containing protein
MRRVMPKIPSDTVRLIARIIFKLRFGGGREIAELPDGQKRQFEDLMSHQKNIVRDSKRIEAFQVFFAVLKECLGEAIPQKPEVLDIYGRILINSFNIMNDDYQSVGIGLYLPAAVLDHSCSPNATVVFSGKELILRTISSAATFSDLRISYTNLLDETETRKKNLKEQYYFECQCSKCSSQEDDPEKSSIRCNDCSTGCVPISTGICSSCQKQANPERINQYVDLVKTVNDAVFRNAGQHPEPEEQCEDFHSQVEAECHPYDKTYLDILEMLYEQRISRQNYEACLVVTKPILEHYHRFYPKYDVNTALMELKTAKLCAYLDKFEQAEDHLAKAKDMLTVTHGTTHSIITTSWAQVKQENAMGKRELTDMAALKHTKTGWAKSG